MFPSTSQSLAKTTDSRNMLSTTCVETAWLNHTINCYILMLFICTMKPWPVLETIREKGRQQETLTSNFSANEKAQVATDTTKYGVVNVQAQYTFIK